MRIELPYPPSVNHYWGYHRRGAYLKKRGVEYRSAVKQLLEEKKVKPYVCPVLLTAAVLFPDNRRRDLDNILKAILDALEHGGAFLDDAQVEGINIYKAGIMPEGAVSVKISAKGE